jgi:hypothetical protein
MTLPRLFYDFDAFGKVTDPGPHMKRIIEEKKGKGRDIALGEHPMLFYFTGKYEVFKAETVFGTITATHSPSHSLPGPRGINVDNKIHVNIAFSQGVTVEEAIAKVDTLLRFLEIIAGRPQSVLRLIFRLAGNEEAPTLLNVYWCMPPSRDAGDTGRQPHAASLPIQAARTPDYFAAVLTAWLGRHHAWRDARFRFSSSFALQHRFTLDRLVGVANMFDILPHSAVPVSVSLTQELEDAKKASRELFKKLTASAEQESILNALGRLGKSTLKHKVRHRAKVTLDRIPATFPELDLVLDEAVRCRNYFVHGTKGKIDYGDEFDQVIFFTEALEFVFAASDLVECGWDIEAWSKQSSIVSHPFDRFRLDYGLRLDGLTRVLQTASSANESDSSEP